MSEEHYISEKKLKLIIFLKKVLNFLFIFGVLFFFSKEIYKYSKNIEYYDEQYIIKYNDFGYALYNKKNELKEIYFYDGIGLNDKGFDIVSYINKNIILQKDKNFLIKIIKKQQIENKDLISFFSTKQQSVILNSGYKIKTILKTNNENDFVLGYIHNLGKKYRYCFSINTLSFKDDENYCIDKEEGNLPMNILGYGNYYFISINKQIFVFSKNSNKIISILNGNDPIIGLSSNNQGDIKIKMTKSIKEIKSVIIDYYIIRKLQGDNVNLNKLLINNL